MKINCIEISINDEELGCQVSFSNKKSGSTTIFVDKDPDHHERTGLRF